MFEPLDLNGDFTHVYVGAGAGRPVIKAIEGAKNAVTVVAPFVSAANYRRLLRKEIDDDVAVTLLVHEIYGLGTKLPVDDVVEQMVTRNEERHKRRMIGLGTSVVLVVLTMVLIGVLSYGWPQVLIDLLTPQYGAGLFAGVLGLVLSIRYFALRYPTHTYSYRTRLSEFCWLGNYNPSNRTDTFHAKCYVVDNRRAFLGSMNFTYSGMNKNIENRVDIEDASAARLLSHRIQKYVRGNNRRVDLQHYGSQMFSEPPHGPSALSRWFYRG